MTPIIQGLGLLMCFVGVGWVAWAGWVDYQNRRCADWSLMGILLMFQALPALGLVLALWK